MYKLNSRSGETVLTVQTENKKKKTWLAVVLSVLLPGLGQIYNGTLGKGLMLIGMNFLITLLNKDFVRQFMEQSIAEKDKPVFWAYMAAGLILTGLAVIDAKMEAENANAGVQRDEE